MIPEETIKAFEAELENLSFGSITLKATVHDRVAKWRIVKKVSIVPEKPSSGGGVNG